MGAGPSCRRKSGMVSGSKCLILAWGIALSCGRRSQLQAQVWHGFRQQVSVSQHKGGVKKMFECNICLFNWQSLCQRCFGRPCLFLCWLLLHFSICKGTITPANIVDIFFYAGCCFISLSARGRLHQPILLTFNAEALLFLTSAVCLLAVYVFCSGCLLCRTE